MSKVFLCAALLLLSVSWVVAQQDSTSPSSAGSQAGSSASQSSTAQTGSSTSSGNETTIQGCLSGSAGSYTLTDNAGISYQLTGDTSQLAKHVNEEVSIRGTQSAASAAGSSANPSTSANNPSSSAGSSTSGASAQSFSVTHVKKISDTCPSKK